MSFSKTLPDLSFSPARRPPSDPLPRSRPPSFPEEADDTSILYQAVKSLYDLSGDVREVYDKHYMPQIASFIDPVVMIKNNTSDCIGQFRALRGLFCKAEIETHSVTRGINKLVVDWKITYYPRGLPSFCAMSVSTITILTLVAPDEGTPERGTGSLRISEHVDHWSLHELISSVPIVSFVYNTLWRPGVGKGSSVLTNVLYGLFVAKNEGPEGIGKEGSPTEWLSGIAGEAGGKEEEEEEEEGGGGGDAVVGGGGGEGGVGVGAEISVYDEAKASD